MEPIFKNSNFAYLLRIWKFITAYNQFLQFPELKNLSLYELAEHIQLQKYQTTFIRSLVKSLLKNMEQYEVTKRKYRTVFEMVKNSRFDIYDEMVSLSAYEMALSEILSYINLKQKSVFNLKASFAELQIPDRYRFFTILVDFLQSGNNFKKYRQDLKVKYNEDMSKADANKAVLAKEYYLKTNPYSCLGFDSNGKVYFCFTNIASTILEFDTKKSVWKKIIGKDNIETEIINRLFNKQAQLKPSEIDLLENLTDIWNKPFWNEEGNSFSRQIKQFNIKQKFQQPSKIPILKQYMKQLEIQYSKYICDCFNARWGNKQRRLAYHREVDEALTDEDFMICFSKFRNQTMNKSQKKKDTLDLYDCRLDTPDVDQQEFKITFIGVCDLYSRGAFNSSVDNTKFIQQPNLLEPVKYFLTSYEQVKAMTFQWLLIFYLTMKQIIRARYDKQIQVRKKEIQRVMQIRQQQKENKAKQKKQGMLRQKGKQVLKRFSGGNDRKSDETILSVSENESSNSTVERKVLPNKGGRNLRDKVRLNYKMANSNSLAKKKEVVSKQYAKAARQQPKRGTKSKGSKMALNSESEEQDMSNNSDSDTQEKSKGLNLDQYQYVSDDQTFDIRRNTRRSPRVK